MIKLNVKVNRNLEDNILRNEDFLGLKDISTEKLELILETAKTIKTMHYLGAEYKPLKGKSLGMIFEKPSTRTRVSFEVAICQLGGYSIYLNSEDIQISRGETVQDTARVLSRYLDGIMIRAHCHKNVQLLAQYAKIPVINGLTNFEHPCQVVADLLTIYEKKKKFKGLKLAYIGDGNNNMSNSLLFGCSKMGINITIGAPKGYQPKKEVLKMAKVQSEKTGSEIFVTEDVYEAAFQADVLYTDVWTSMGQEEENEKRLTAFKGYQINKKLLKYSAEDAIVMHCLPANRGQEITDDVIEGPHSVVFDEAENRLHAQKAILALVLS